MDDTFGFRLIKLIVVEDDPTLCQLYADNLGRDARITTATALNMTDATKLCRLERQVALLVDLDLPDAQGIEAVSRGRREAPGAPIIAISGRDELREKAMAAGAHGWIDKASPQSFGDEQIKYVLSVIDKHTNDLIFAPILSKLDKMDDTIKESVDRAASRAAKLLDESQRKTKVTP